MRRALLVLLSVVFLISLAACGGGTTPAATTAPAGQAEAPAPEAPAEPPASDVPALSQTVTSSNGVTVSYPEGWRDPVADIGVFLYNNQDGESTISFMRARPGGLAFQINWQPDSPEERTLEENFAFFFNPLVSGLGITLDPTEVVTLGEAEVIKSTGANTSPGSELGLYTALKRAGDGFITFMVYLDPNEIEQRTPLIEAILASTTYAEPGS